MDLLLGEMVSEVKLVLMYNSDADGRTNGAPYMGSMATRTLVEDKLGGVYGRDNCDDLLENASHEQVLSAWEYVKGYLKYAKPHFYLRMHEHGLEFVYASLIGPLRGYYVRVPDAENGVVARAMLNSTKVYPLHWMSIYTIHEVRNAINKFGGQLIRIKHLEYDYYEVQQARIRSGVVGGPENN